MAKISGLPLAQNLTGDEQLPIVQAGETRGATMTALRALITPFLQNWYKGDRGEVGTSGNTYTPESGGIVAFKASDVSRGKASLLRLPGVADGDVYWKPGDATPDDGQNYFSSTFPGAIGRWARQGVGGVAFRQSLAGAIVRSAEDKLRDMVSAKDFGAKGDGQTNDTLAINRAIDTGKSVFFPTGVYPYDPSAKALAFGQYLTGESPLTTRIAKVSGGDMFMMAAGSGLSNIGLQGNGGSSVSGRGILLPANTSNVTLTNVNMLDFEGYCVEVTASNGGSQLRVIGGLYTRTDDTKCAIRLPVADTQASPRQFVGVNSTGWLIDTAGADNTILSGCYCRNMIHGSASKKTLVSGCRFGTISGDYVVSGIDHAIVGNAMAGRIVLAPGTQTSFVKANVNVLGAADSSGNETNQTDFSYYGSRIYDPVSMPNGGSETFDVHCPGAKLGMFVQATFSESLSGALLGAYIATADTVTVRIINNTGGDLNLPNGTFRVGARQL